MDLSSAVADRIRMALFASQTMLDLMLGIRLDRALRLFLRVFKLSALMIH